jgi:hypothetical protein
MRRKMRFFIASLLGMIVVMRYYPEMVLCPCVYNTISPIFQQSGFSPKKCVDMPNHLWYTLT